METITAETFREQGRRVRDLIFVIAEDEQLCVLLDDIPHVKKLRAKSRREGRLEGRLEGQLEGQQKAWQLAFKNIRQTLAIRFNTPLEKYDLELKPLDLPALEQLNELAFTTPTLSEFEATLQQLKPPSES